MKEEEGRNDLRYLRKSNNTIINFLPPRSLWDLIVIRRKITVTNLRGGPHITFIDPFIEFSCITESLKQTLATYLSDFAPFEIYFPRPWLNNNKSCFTVFSSKKLLCIGNDSRNKPTKCICKFDAKAGVRISAML